VEGNDIRGLGLSAPSRSTHLPIATTSCTFRRQPETRAGRPSRSLLSILGVLRRPASHADMLGSWFRAFPGESVYIADVRLARVVDGSSFYVIPYRFTPCGKPTLKPYDTLEFWLVHRVGGRALDGGAVGGERASQIQQAGLFLPPRDGFVAGVVPDGVANVTLRYPTATVSITPNGNVIAANVGDLRDPYRPLSIVWRSANGTILRTFRGGVL
jgi:hypothetical protein